MSRIITKSNLLKNLMNKYSLADQDYLRGYNSETFITGEFLINLVEKRIKPLSVSDISDKFCPTRRNLYFRKGKNKPTGKIDKKTWGRTAGDFTEKFFRRLMEEDSNKKNKTYNLIINQSEKYCKRFFKKENKTLSKMRKFDLEKTGIMKGDTEWLKEILKHNATKELSQKALHFSLYENDSISLDDLKMDEKLEPDPHQIGINRPASPDFIIPEQGIIGDIKTGFSFIKYHLLTCAGYALAYENANKDGFDINWGMIYFVPSRNPSDYAKVFTLSQIYFFPVDTPLRKWFLSMRDRAYRIISGNELPDFPDEKEREECIWCKYKDYCIQDGLELIIDE